MYVINHADGDDVDDGMDCNAADDGDGDAHSDDDCDDDADDDANQ